MIEKVCHIGPALNVQGGISSVLCCYRDAFRLPNENFIASYNGSFVRSLPLLFFVCFRLLIFPSQKFELYQIHTSSYGSFFRKYLISLCLRIRRKKYIVHIHGSMFDKFCSGAPWFVKWMVGDYFRSAVKILVLSSEMKDILWGVDSSLDNFDVVPNPGANISEYPEELEKHALPVKIIFSGRFGKRKGVFDLIQAFSETRFHVPAKLFLFGDGEIEKVRYEVEHSLKRNDIAIFPWLEHEKYIKELPKYDFLVLPSYAERFSMSLVEALGVGLPVISTFVGGTTEVVENGVCGILNEAGNIQALTGSLEKLVNDKALRIRMGKAGWNRAKTCFAPNVILEKLERIYAESRCRDA